MSAAKRGRPAGPAKPVPVVPLPGLVAARKAAAVTCDGAGAIIRISKAHYSKVERGTVRLDVARAVTLARRFGVTVESFL